VNTIIKKQNFPGFERYATHDKWAISFISSTMPKVGYNMRKILAGKSDPYKLGFNEDKKSNAITSSLIPPHTT
jgi:hypothetical protein